MKNEIPIIERISAKSIMFKTEKFIALNMRIETRKSCVPKKVAIPVYCFFLIKPDFSSTIIKIKKR